MKKLEKEHFAHENSDDETESGVKGRTPSFLYLGATGYDIKDDVIVNVSVNSQN